MSARVFYPLWFGTGLDAETGVAPYLFGNGDALSAELGPTYGYEARLGVKWGTSHVAAFGGYSQVGFGNYGFNYSYSAGGPEVSLVWRF